MFAFLSVNGYIEHRIQKGFMPKLSGMYEHTAQMSHIINKARIKQRSVVITLLDLKNAFGENHLKGGLEIILKVSFCISALKRRYLGRLMELINKNYDASEGEFEEFLEANLDSQESDSDDLGEPGPMIMIDDECNHTEDDSPVTKNPDVLIIDD